MQYNEARSGGALYNLGYTEIESRGFMRANKALVSRPLLAENSPFSPYFQSPTGMVDWGGKLEKEIQ